MEGARVRYALEGSVQRDRNRTRVNAQLIDAESGAHLSADRFQQDVADLFKLQDDVVANALSYELVRAEAGAATRSKNPDAIHLTMRGLAALYQWQQQPPTKDSHSHQPFPPRERAIQRFRSMKTLQRFS